MPRLSPLTLLFLRPGLTAFSGPAAHAAMMEDEVVRRRQWLTRSQLLDAVPVGQVTPGPVFTTATFIRYLLGGLPGALAATAGIFLPGFLLVAASGPQLSRSPTDAPLARRAHGFGPSRRPSRRRVQPGFLSR